MTDFLRQVTLVVYSNGQWAATYNSDGTRNTIGISFSVAKTIVGTPNESTVVLTNLSPRTKSVILASANQQASVELYVGYKDGGANLLATGSLIKIWPERGGTSDTLTLTFFDGYTAIKNSHIEAKYAPGTDLNDVIFDIAFSFVMNNIKGVKRDKTKIQVIGSIGERGLTVSGRTATVLDNLATSYGFTWSIQDGVFQAYDDFLPVDFHGQRVYKVGAENLFKATPEIGEQYMQQVGMKIEALLNPKCKCGDLIDLESKVYPQYNGKYQIHNITFTGDTVGQDWKMEIDSKTIIK